MIRYQHSQPLFPTLIRGSIAHFAYYGLLVIVALITIEELTIMDSGRTFIWLLGIAVFYFWIIKKLALRQSIRVGQKPTIIVSLWFLLGLMSYFWATYPDVVLERLPTLFQLIILFLIFQDLFNSKKSLDIAASIFFVCCFIISVYAIVVYTNQELFRVSLIDTQNPAHLGQVLGIGFLFTYYLSHKTSNYKYLIYLASGTIAVAILLTGTRAVWVGIVGALLFGWLLSQGKTIRFRNVAIVFLVLLFIVYYLISLELIRDDLAFRIQTAHDIEATGGGAGRLNIYKVGWEMVKDNIWLGVGLQNFPHRFIDYIGRATLYDFHGISTGRAPHNIFLSVAAELGIVGFGLLVSLFLVIGKQLMQAIQDFRSNTALFLLLFVIITGFFIDIYYRKYFWFVLAFSVATILMNNKQEDK